MSETKETTEHVVRGGVAGGVAIGVFWYVWGIYGFWWGVLYGLFWPIWIGYRLANYLLGVHVS